jgi:hypothetical protein
MKPGINQSFYTIAAIVSLLLLSSCATTKITSVWMDEKKAGTTFKDILVIGISEQETNRRLFEQHFAEQLNLAGVEGEASYIILPQDAEISRETVSAAIKGKSIDAVIVTHLIGVEEQTVYRESMEVRPTYSHYSGLYEYYPYVHGYVNQPGYYTTHEIVKLETSLYEVASEALVWSAQSQTFAPASANEVIEDVVKVVIRDLQEKGLIKAE